MKKISVIVDSKKCSITYNKENTENESYAVQPDDEYLKQQIPNGFKFWIKNGQAVYLITDANIQRIAKQIIPQIGANE